MFNNNNNNNTQLVTRHMSVNAYSYIYERMFDVPFKLYCEIIIINVYIITCWHCITSGPQHIQLMAGCILHVIQMSTEGDHWVLWMHIYVRNICVLVSAPVSYVISSLVHVPLQFQEDVIIVYKWRRALCNNRCHDLCIDWVELSDKFQRAGEPAVTHAIDVVDRAVHGFTYI